jgi:hypothetical protein
MMDSPSSSEKKTLNIRDSCLHLGLPEAQLYLKNEGLDQAISFFQQEGKNGFGCIAGFDFCDVAAS